MNQSHQRLALNYVFDVTMIAYLQAFKYASGLCNPNNEMKISIPVY